MSTEMDIVHRYQIRALEKDMYLSLKSQPGMMLG
jgi:hypothetical protein